MDLCLVDRTKTKTKPTNTKKNADNLTTKRRQPKAAPTEKKTKMKKGFEHAKENRDPGGDGDKGNNATHTQHEEEEVGRVTRGSAAKKIAMEKMRGA